MTSLDIDYEDRILRILNTLILTILFSKYSPERKYKRIFIFYVYNLWFTLTALECCFLYRAKSLKVSISLIAGYIL